MFLNIPDITVCIHLRIDSPIRLKNVISILNWLTKMTNGKIVVMEADSVQRGMLLDSIEKVKYIYVQDYNPIFHFTKYRNKLIQMASTPIVALWDADVIAPADQLSKAVDKIRKTEAVLSWPYDGICYQVPEEVAGLFEATIDMDALILHKNKFLPMFGSLNTGGIFFANRKSYMEIGMDNENMFGWGPEDTERLKRATILGLPVYRVRGELYHLWHPRGNNSMYNDLKRQNASIIEFLKVCGSSRDELSSYILSWPWTKQNKNSFKKHVYIK